MATPGAGDAGASHRYGDVCQGLTGQGSAGQGDGPDGSVTREDVSRERRIRHGHGAARCPEYVARLPTAGHGHREVGARERAIDEENPDPVRGPCERQHASLGYRFDTVDPGPKILVRQVAQHLDARRGLELKRSVGAEEISVRPNCGHVGVRRRHARNRAAGIGEHAAGGDTYISGDGGAGTGYRCASQYR